MTCIVGIAENGGIWMGGDSAGVGGLDLTVRKDKKVFKNGDYIMGFTTSFRMGQLLEFSFAPPKAPAKGDMFRFMVADFVPSLRDCLKAGGFAKKENERETGGCFLVGVKGRLFAVWDDYQVAETKDGFDAVGCGQNVAFGSLYSTKGMKPLVRVRLALSAAQRFSAGVRAPFHIETSEQHIRRAA